MGHPDPNNAVTLILTGVTGADSTIDGTWQSLNDQEADWAGFQLDLQMPTSVTPEPGSLVLLGTGLLGVASAAQIPRSLELNKLVLPSAYVAFCMCAEAG